MPESTALIDRELESRLDARDLGAPTCGFFWYRTVSRIDP